MPRYVLWTSGTLLLSQRPGDRTRVVSLGVSCHHTLRHVTSPTAPASVPNGSMSFFSFGLAILLICFSFIN